MATYTTNFNLEKPAQNEAVDVDVLNSNSDIIDDNLGQVKQLALNIGYGYNNQVPYYVDDYCIYENKLYKCIQNIVTPENFDISKWQQCNLANELQNIKGNPDGNITETLTKLQIGNNIYKIEEGANDNIAETYDATSTYNVGDYVIYHDDLYKCITAVSVAEPFDSNKWTECLVTDELGSGGGGSGGHTILDNDGTALTQRDEMQFVGTYSEDDSTNEITKVNIVREMTKAEFDLLSDDEKKGVIVTTDEPTYSGRYGETVLSSTVTTLGSGATINLSDDYTNYDAIYINFEPVSSTVSNYNGSLIKLVSDIELNTDYVGYSVYDSYNYGFLYQFTDSDTMSAEAISPSNANMKINKIVGIKFGGASSGSDETYSTDERAVGTWIDGSTIYQKTFELTTAVIVSNNTWTSTGISKGDIDKIISCEGMTSDGTCWGDLCATPNVDSYINLLTSRNGDTESVKWFTIKYTKSTT